MEFEPTLLPSRERRSTAEPYHKAGVISQPRYGKIARHPLAELDNGVVSIGGYTESCYVGCAWHRFAAASIGVDKLCNTSKYVNRIKLKSHLDIITTDQPKQVFRRNNKCKYILP